ncbi:MAG: cobalt ABC transporter permease [Paenirhodobacter sp.]|uniref:cobalt ABC transporter permease n=1 Tax=Paenirhodobacter sp. TaxID=1965326 RepID=UPI003D1037C4
MSRSLILSAALALALALGAGPAAAHKVIASAYPSGTEIEGEIGFSNGDMAKNATVEVLGPDGTRLGETVTDAEGAFTFTPHVAVAHEFHADLGAGHQVSFTMTQEDVEQVLRMQQDTAQAGAEAAAAVGGTPAAAPQGASAGPAAPAPAPGGVVTLSMADKLAIAAMLRDEVRPLRREIDAYREHNDLQRILGGIGYILGLFGIGFYVAGRRRSLA